MKITKKFLKLNSGHKIPIVGLGTWKSNHNDIYDAIKYAVSEAGYLHIDSAYIYENEKEVGQAINDLISEGFVKRENLFVTNKLWNTFHGKNDVIKACKRSLKTMKLDYFDLYLVHWAIPTLKSNPRNATGKNGKLITQKIPLKETWRAMEELVKKGLVKSIGVANINCQLMIDLLSYAKIPPAINQIECHPYNQQKDFIQFCHNQDIMVTAYCPLGTPGNIKSGKIKGDQPILLKDPIFSLMSKKYNKSSAQIILKWAIQNNIIVIPKSTNTKHILSNIDIFDFKLTKLEMNAISKINKKHRFLGNDHCYGVPYFS